MKNRLIILSDLWGNEKAEWISIYIKALSVTYEVKFYDSCSLAGISTINLSEEERHLFFVDRGIENAVNELLRLEKEEVSILAFSVGGVIGWKAILRGLNATKFIAISSTRLRYEIEKPLSDVILYYGELDSFKPKGLWFEKMKEIKFQVEPNKKHAMYKEEEIMNKVCLKLLS